MSPLVLALLLTTVTGAPSAPDDLYASERPDRTAARAQRDRCFGAGAAGAVGAAVGLVVGGGLAVLGVEAMKLANPADTSTPKSVGAFAIPFGAIAGGVAGLAAGTIGAWELTEELAEQPDVMR